MNILTLLIAALGLVVASLSLGWQLASYILDGRRIRVTLLHGTMGAHGLVVGPVGRDGKPKDLTRIRAEGFDGLEVVGVTATNVGRAPATISRYSVQLKRGGFSYTPVGDKIGPDFPYRLEPGESAAWYSAMQDARALVAASSTVTKVSHDVRMAVELGTGDTIKTRRVLDVRPLEDPRPGEPTQ